jgi:thiazole synthase
MVNDILKIADRTFTSRLFIGTGKFPSVKTLRDSISASGAQIITVALRRVDLDNTDDGIISAIDRTKQLLPQHQRCKKCPGGCAPCKTRQGSGLRKLAKT